MTRVAILTNIPSPYRVDLFVYLQGHFPDLDIHVLFASRNERNRSWTVDISGLHNTHFLASKTLRIPGPADDRFVHLPADVGKTLTAIAPDVVVASEYNPVALQALSWAQRRRVPFVSWTDGTLHSERDINRMQRWSRRRIVRHAATFIASSTASRKAQIAYGANPERILVSYLTVDTDKYFVDNQRKDDHTILYVGSLIPRKGLDLLLSALVLVEKPFTLDIVGDGPEREALAAQAQSLGIADRVTFHGFQEGDALKAFYARSSLFVLPTREDCYGLVVLEAMCAGLPVICSQYADGAGDLIDDGRTGVIIDPERERDFAFSLHSLLDTPSALDTMGRAAREKAGGFSLARVAGPFTEAIYTATGRDRQ